MSLWRDGSLVWLFPLYETEGNGTTHPPFSSAHMITFGVFAEKNNFPLFDSSGDVGRNILRTLGAPLRDQLKGKVRSIENLEWITDVHL